MIEALAANAEDWDLETLIEYAKDGIRDFYAEASNDLVRADFEDFCLDN